MEKDKNGKLESITEEEIKEMQLKNKLRYIGLDYNLKGEEIMEKAPKGATHYCITDWVTDRESGLPFIETWKVKYFKAEEKQEISLNVPQEKRLNVLVGGYHMASCREGEQFAKNYEGLANFEFEDEPAKFVKKAKEKKYDAFIIGLDWDGRDYYNADLGFTVLEAIKDKAAKVIVMLSRDELENKFWLNESVRRENGTTIERFASREEYQRALYNDK